MTFFSLNEPPSNYQIESRDRHSSLIQTITGVSLKKANALSDCFQLREIKDIPDSTMIQIGFSKTQIAKIRAAYDFGKSQFLGIPKIQNLENLVNDPEVAAKIVQELIGDSRIEKACLLVLNVKHEIIAKEILSIGTETECLVNLRNVFEIVLRHGGTRFLFAHNHPSRSLDASKEDLELTEQLIEGSELMGIPILDHLIVSRDQFNSLRNSTMLWNYRDQVTH